MENIDLLVSKLDGKLRSLHQEQSLAIKTRKTNIAERPLLPEYLKMTDTGGITPAVEFIVLDALSKYFNLYEGDRERQQILAAMVAEIRDSTTADISASVQVMQNAYPSIYLLVQQKLILIRFSHINTIAKVFEEPKTRSRLVMGIIILCAAISGAILSTNLNKPLSSNSSNASENLQTPAPLAQASSQNNDLLPAQTSNPTQTETPQQVPIIQSSPVVTEEPKSGLSISSYQSHCTLLSAKGKSDNIIDDNCNISQTIDLRNYTLNWTNGEVSHVEIISDNQAIIDGEQAKVVDKNLSGITIGFSKGRIGWDLKQ